MKLKNLQETQEILEIILSIFPDKIIELNYETPFQLLSAVILSAQTTDKQVNKITPPFFAKVREPNDVLNLSIEEIENDLKYVNFYKNKSKFIRGCAEKLVTEFESTIPNDLKTLQTFPGVGVKTAKVVLSVLYGAPYVGVDTHIHRVCNRVGIVKTKTPEETDKAVEKKFSEHQKAKMHHAIVLFGRYICTAKKPQCENCLLRNTCNYYKGLAEKLEKLKK